jgi:hypothetical protein
MPRNHYNMLPVNKQQSKRLGDSTLLPMIFWAIPEKGSGHRDRTIAEPPAVIIIIP